VRKPQQADYQGQACARWRRLPIVVPRVKELEEHATAVRVAEN